MTPKITIAIQRKGRLFGDSKNLLVKSGINIICPNIEDQKIFEKKHKIENFVNYNSDHRRNIGFLLAIINNYNFIISMDDDNFPITKNFIFWFGSLFKTVLQFL